MHVHIDDAWEHERLADVELLLGLQRRVALAHGHDAPSGDAERAGDRLAFRQRQPAAHDELEWPGRAHPEQR